MTLVAKASLAVLALTFTSSLAAAHTALCACYDNGDSTVLCEGGFSDGASAAGVTMKVLGADGTVILEGKMAESSEFTFDKPDGVFKVLFDAGEGHLIEIPSTEIY